VIAVVSNLVPERLIKLVNAALAGDYVAAREQHYALLPLMQAMGVEVNPIPVKTALGLLGRCSPELRLPLTALRQENVPVLRKALQGLGLS
jgi:4-hydroxy-tetrahydrodipicolinate synthase